VWPVVESYWVSCLYLFKLSKDNSVLELDKLQKEIQWFAQSLIMERITLYLESISIDTIRNACTTLKGLNIIKEVKEAGRKVVKMVES
jgi:phosphate uptake regulator